MVHPEYRVALLPSRRAPRQLRACILGMPALTPRQAFATLELAANLVLNDRMIPCRSGGIGRRAWFRSMYSQGCGGSSPLFGTKSLSNSEAPRSGFRERGFVVSGLGFFGMDQTQSIGIYTE